jgi:hypothetical protein
MVGKRGRVVGGHRGNERSHVLECSNLWQIILPLVMVMADCQLKVAALIGDLILSGVGVEQ